MRKVNIFENIINNKDLEHKPFGGKFLDNLFSNELFIEAFLYYCLEVEDKIKLAIQGQELGVSMILKQKGLIFKRDKDFEKPLGQLIVRLSLYCDNKKLISDLKKFNQLRRKVFHNLLKEDREKVNEEIKQNILHFYSLIMELLLYGSKNLEGTVKEGLKIALKNKNK